MKTLGRHVLVELHGCSAEHLNNPDYLERLLEEAAEAAQATVVASTSHRFSPAGATAVVVLEESHLSLHTWPEAGYAAADLFTCGECAPGAAIPILRRGLEATRAEVLELARGGARPGPSITVESHEHEGDDDALPPAHAFNTFEHVTEPT